MKEISLECYALSPEMNFILSLAVREDSPVIPQEIDWQRFETLVAKNRIEPLIAEGIKKLPTDVVQGNHVLEKLLACQKDYMLFAIRQMQALVSIMQNFATNDIRALSLKGPILAIELYGNPTLRYSRDLDILVSENDLEDACRILEKLGYKEEITIRNKTPLRRRKLEKRGEEMHRVYMKEDICIELHWRLSFRVKESFDELWNNSQTKTMLGSKIHYLSQVDNISYLIVHAAGHGYQRLRWLLDIYELQKDSTFSIENVYQHMKNQGVSCLMIETMLVLYLISGLNMKQQENPYFCIKRGNEKVVVSYQESIEKDVCRGCDLAKSVYPLLEKETMTGGMAGRKYDSLLPTLGRKNGIIRTLIEIIEPCKADLELIDLPDSLYFLYYIIRPFHKIWRMMPFYKEK